MNLGSFDYEQKRVGTRHVSLRQSPGRPKGTRREVWEYVAFKTSGGLTRGALMKNRSGAIVSKAASEAARARLARPGNPFAKYLAEKGSRAFKLSPKKRA